MDHIKPVVDPKKGFTTWDDFINRLYCEESNLQAICKGCHSAKTRQEKECRKLSKMEKTMVTLKKNG